MVYVQVLLAAVVGAAATTGHLPAPSPSPTQVLAASVRGTEVCAIADERLTEISGLVATDVGYVAINDGSDSESRRKVFFLDTSCAVTRTLSYPSRPRDTEDMVVASDGTIWIADIGDNNRSRQSVAVWRLAKGATSPVLHRLAYPDGAHDAEALLLAADGMPIVVTKDPSTPGLYAPVGPLRAGATVAMSKVGQFSLPRTTTGNPFSVFGRLVVTGGAVAPDGSRVVLRTYADAIEFDVTDGDVVKAITTGVPRITPLPDEPQGESITYSRDGRLFLTVSETADQPPGTAPAILSYPPAVGPVAAVDSDPTDGPLAEPSAPSAGQAPRDRLGLDGLARLLGAVAGAAVVLATLGVLGIRRARQ